MNVPPRKAQEGVPGPDRPETGHNAAAADRVANSRPGIDQKVLDDIFGDVLPDTTTDERDPGPAGDGFSDQWYRENRPPHHGG